MLIRRGRAAPIRQLRACRRGIAAMEFALVAPVFFVMVIGVSDLSEAMIVQQQVYNAAHMIPISASSLAVQPDKSTALTATQVQQTLSAIFAAIPRLRNGSLTGQTSVTMSSVTFIQADSACNPAKATCAMVPRVVWSVPYVDPPGRNPNNGNSFQSVTRPCMQLGQVSPTQGSGSDLTTLPTANVTNPDPILVVDVHYQFTPNFFKFITGPIDFWASGYWSVRSVDPNAAVSLHYTRYDVANQKGGVGKCPGYP